jgi:Trk K+ transport system NAD-binding subunit
MRLVRSHVRFDLPGHRELDLAVVPEQSPIAGKSLASLYQQLSSYQFEVIAITRREHVLLPHPDTLLDAGDRLLLITSPEVRQPLQRFLTPLVETAPAPAQ